MRTEEEQKQYDEGLEDLRKKIEIQKQWDLGIPEISKGILLEYGRGPYVLTYRTMDYVFEDIIQELEESNIPHIVNHPIAPYQFTIRGCDSDKVSSLLVKYD